MGSQALQIYLFERHGLSGITNIMVCTPWALRRYKYNGLRAIGFQALQLMVRASWALKQYKYNGLSAMGFQALQI